MGNLTLKKSTLQCAHCRSREAKDYIFVVKGSEKLNFCCEGCKAVYSIIQNLDLLKYYRLKDRPSEPIEQNQDHSFYDKEFDSYANTGEVHFFVKGLTCIACVWLLEKLPELLEEVISVRVNFTQSHLKIKLSPNFRKISKVINFINSLGYQVTPLKKGENTKLYLKRESHSELIRIGICGMITGNIMLFSIANYSGATGSFRYFFDILSGFLSLPIIFYGAIPFYKNLKTDFLFKKISVDTLLVISLLVGWGLSLYSLFNHSRHLYFDTLSMLVFLVLSSRYYLKSSQEKFVTKISSSALKPYCTKLKGKVRELVSTNEVNIGDLVLYQSGETLQFDSTLYSSRCEVDESSLTGESKPVLYHKGAQIRSGCKILNNESIFLVDKRTNDSYLSGLAKTVEELWDKRSYYQNYSDKVAQGLIVIIFFTSIALLFQINELGLYEVLERVLALTIITCPCALGLAPSLVNLKSLNLSFRKGIVLKDATVLERLTSLKSIFFDKTGTLTEGDMTLTGWSGEESAEIYSVLYQVEQDSRHPIAIAIMNYLEGKSFNRNEKIKVRNFPGIGILALSSDFAWEIKGAPSSLEIGTSIKVIKDGEVVAELSFNDKVREDAKDVISRLNKKYQIEVLTGDSKESCESLCKNIGIKKYQWRMTPDSKKQVLIKKPNSLMIGDGLNDSLALAISSVSVAMNTSNKLAMDASDVWIRSKSLESLEKLLNIARETKKVMTRNIVFTLIYNTIGITLAFQGLIDPLTAAILMPLSSLVVFGSSVWGTHYLRKEA